MKNKYINTLVFLFTIAFQTVCQITVTNTTFPVPGDSLKTSTDLNFSNFDPSIAGGDVTWDFTSLNEGIYNVDVFGNASEGSAAADYPDADIVRLGSNGAQDIYYKTSNNRIVEEGRSGLDPVFGAVEIDANVDGNAVFRRAPLTMGDTYDDEYGFSLEIPVSSLPDSIAALFGGLVSDLRVRVDFIIADEVDAWGMVSLPDTDHEVVRLRRETTTHTNVEVKFFGNWVSLLDLPIQLPDFARQLIEPVTVTNYIFLSDTDKEEVANITVDSLGTILTTSFKVNNVVSSIDEKVFTSISDIVAYPNPSYGNVTFAFQNLPSDRYRVDVFDILGRKTWSRNTVIGQQAIEADLSHLKRGTYLYRVYDSNNNKLVTKRLMIIRP